MKKNQQRPIEGTNDPAPPPDGTAHLAHEYERRQRECTDAMRSVEDPITVKIVEQLADEHGLMPSKVIELWVEYRTACHKIKRHHDRYRKGRIV